jgi:SAM-dependent methyltransferase
MRKKHLHDQYGINEKFWDANWRNPFPGSPVVDGKLIRCIEKHLKPGSRLLEGGCGNANYLRYFHQKGHSITGVDFAVDTIARIKRSFPHLDIVQGNILKLQFHDGIFDAYFSGGVVEHFENGVDDALREAARVLKPGGLFFVTVPHLNIARKLSALIWPRKYIVDLDHRLAYIEERLKAFTSHSSPSEYHFHEYEFDSREMRRFLGKFGFSVLQEMPFSTMWGIRDLQPYWFFAGHDLSHPNFLHKIVRRVVRLTENIDSHPGTFAQFLSVIQSALFGNLKLYVCKSSGIKDT